MSNAPEAQTAHTINMESKLLAIMVGGCTCLTKTPELKYHAERCHYRLASEALALLPAPTQPPRFPTMLRKMWSSTEVQEWIDGHWPEPTSRDGKKPKLACVLGYETACQQCAADGKCNAAEGGARLDSRGAAPEVAGDPVRSALEQCRNALLAMGGISHVPMAREAVDAANAALGVPAAAPREQVSPALARQRRLVATLPQTAEEVALLTPCAAIGKGTTPVHCGHCAQTVTPGGACARGVQVTVKEQL